MRRPTKNRRERERKYTANQAFLLLFIHPGSTSTRLVNKLMIFIDDLTYLNKAMQKIHNTLQDCPKNEWPQIDNYYIK